MINVVLRWECPNISLTTAIGEPDSISRVANVWRSPCKVIFSDELGEPVTWCWWIYQLSIFMNNNIRAIGPLGAKQFFGLSLPGFVSQRVFPVLVPPITMPTPSTAWRFFATVIIQVWKTTFSQLSPSVLPNACLRLVFPFALALVLLLDTHTSLLFL